MGAWPNHLLGTYGLLRLARHYAGSDASRATDLLAHAINVAADCDEHRMVRMMAIEALGLSGATETESVRRLVQELAVRDDEPVINRTAMKVLGLT